MTIQLDWLRGCATALVTPFTASGAVDEPRLRDLIEYQIAGGVRILVPCGTTGESVTMSDEENRFVIRTTVELARGRAKVIAGTGSCAPTTELTTSSFAKSPPYRLTRSTMARPPTVSAYAVDQAPAANGAGAAASPNTVRATYPAT